MYQKRILAIRLSALGDVAILEPVLRSRAAANPDVLFLLAAPPMLEPLFRGIENVQFIPTQKKQSICTLYKQLSRLQPTMVADMHHVNRVIAVDWLFRINGVPVKSVDKTNAQGKFSWKRYDEVFDQCGLKPSSPSLAELSKQYWSMKDVENGTFRIGIAPFAQHRGKIWPMKNIESLISTLNAKENFQIVLFGSKKESEILDPLAERYDHVTSLAGKMSFEEELKQIEKLNVMVSMDSSNMHFASCLGVPVVSIWGATHANRGFYGWRQNPEWRVEIDMECRPCSKYGNKPCRYGDYRCMTSVTVEMVAEKIAALCGDGF